MEVVPPNIFHHYKPAVSKKTHLLLAAMLWSCVGIGLVIRGVLMLYTSDSLILILPAFVLGNFKSLFMLDKSAKKSIDRILRLADGSCFGAVYSVKTWLLVLAMMVMGYLLRRSAIPLHLTGALYVSIGWALFFSSRTGWRVWKELRE